MSSSTAPPSGRLTAHWVRVVDASGRVRLEQRWTVPAAAPLPSPTPDRRSGLTTAA